MARHRLSARCAEATGQVLRILAPAGYGKSTQVADWVARERRDVAWVDLRPIDNDPRVLAAALTQALSGAGGLAGSVLVLDDVHHVDAEASLELLHRLAANLPADSTLVLSGRGLRGTWATGRLRLRPGVVDVTTADLALDVDETRQLLSTLEPELEPDEIARLAAGFEGWPAGLRLAGLALRSGVGPPSASTVDEGDAPFVVDYLRAEWTAHLAPEPMRFLREAACLERFSDEMCDAVLGRRWSATLRRRLQREDQLLVPLDGSDTWFRMHPLLARWLSSDLKRTDPERWCSVHRAAARWWERGGDVDRAFDHATAAGDDVMREALAATHGPSYLARGLGVTVRRWRETFSAERLRSSPALCALGAADALHHGDGTRAMHWCDLLERRLGLGDGTDGTVLAAEPAALSAHALRASLGRSPAADLIPLAEHAAAHLDGGPWHALAHIALGGLRFLTADPRAAESFTAGEFEAELADLPLAQASCVAAGAILAELGGDRRRAAEAGRRARALMVDHEPALGPTTVFVDAVHALGAARSGRHDLARDALATARRKLLGYEAVAPWYNVLARLPLARVALLIDERVAGRTLLGEIDRHLEREPDGNGARVHVEVLRASADATSRMHEASGTSLTGAELKVLRYMPTNLTIADIATQLFVSRNTVKTHVAAIHRKLGTASRAETVSLARRSGLLDEADPRRPWAAASSCD